MRSITRLSSKTTPSLIATLSQFVAISILIIGATLLYCEKSWADALCGPTEAQYIDELVAGLQQFAGNVTNAGAFAIKEEYPGNGTSTLIISFVESGKKLFTHRVHLSPIAPDTAIRPTKSKDGRPGFSIALGQGRIGTCNYRVTSLDRKFEVAGGGYSGKFQSNSGGSKGESADTQVANTLRTGVPENDSRLSNAKAAGELIEDLSSKPEQGAIPEGAWEGKVRQGNVTYLVTMNIRASQLNAPAGTIDYPGLGCGGSIVLTKVSNALFVYREIIERGQNKCANGGLLSLSVNPDGSAEWKYLSPNNPVDVLATAKLQRASAPAQQSTRPLQLDPQWLGKWNGFSTKVRDPERSTLEISEQTLKYSSMVGDEGQYQMSTLTCKRSSLQDALRHYSLPPHTLTVNSFLFSLSQQTKSKDDFSGKLLEETKTLHEDKRFDKRNRTMSEAIQKMKPGKYPVIVLYLNGEINELVLTDGILWILDADGTGIGDMYTKVAR